MATIDRLRAQLFGTFALLFCLSGAALGAENAELKVTDADGQPLIGASIRVVGTTQGTVTDINGEASLSVADGQCVEVDIGYTGFEGKKVTLCGGSNQRVALDPQGGLDDIIFGGPTANSRTDFGGGNRFGDLVFGDLGGLVSEFDRELDKLAGSTGGYHTGIVTSRIAPIRFANGAGRIFPYAQINVALTDVDNGNPSGENTYLATNAASPNFVGALATYRLNGDILIGGRFTLGAAFNRSDLNTDFDDDAGCDERERDRNFCLYDANVFVHSETFGRITIGRGETASAGIGGITLGGIAHVTNSDPTLRGGWHEVFNTGRRLGDIAPDTTGVTRGDIVRYDSPTIAGFVISGSFGEADHSGAPYDADDYWDVALRYAGEFGAVRVAGGASYQDYDRIGKDYSQSNATVSASVQHVPTGLFVSGSASAIERDAPFSPGKGETDSASAYYVHVGARKNWFGIGATTVYGEYGRTSSGGEAGAFFYDNSKTTNFGLGVVQNIDAAAMSLYLTFNSIDADIGGVDGEDMDIITAGARVKF